MKLKFALFLAVVAVAAMGCGDAAKEETVAPDAASLKNAPPPAPKGGAPGSMPPATASGLDPTK